MQATLERLRQRREEGHEGGFTLIELLIVIVILAILAAIVVFAVQNLTKSSSQASCGSDFKTVETAAEAYKAQTTVYPGAVLPATYTGHPLATADGKVGKTAGQATQIDELLGTVDINGATVGPWLKDVPANTGHYAVGMTGATGTLAVYNGTGTSATVANCAAVTQ